MRITVDTDYILDKLRLDEYGYGIPFAFTLLGLYLLLSAAPGLSSFGTISGYAKIGVGVIVVLCVASFAAAGYTYRSIDKTWWLLDKFRDGPEGIRDGRKDGA